MRDSKLDFQTQIHNNITQNDQYICLQQRIEAKLEKKSEEKKKNLNLPRGEGSDSSKRKTRKFLFQKTPTPSFDDDSPRFDVVLKLGIARFCKELKKKEENRIGRERESSDGEREKKGPDQIFC